MRAKTLLRKLTGLGRAVVIGGWELVEADGQRDHLRVWVRRRGRCGRCGAVSGWYDRGGGVRCWRHVDIGYATCELVGDAPRVRDVVAERAPDAIVCLDTFRVVSWATDALDEVRREEWNKLRQAGAARAAKEFKGLRFLLRHNWGIN